jgi:hypothetical protein
MALRQVFSEYFGFPCQFSFHRLPHTNSQLSARAGTIDQIVTEAPNGINLTPPQETRYYTSGNRYTLPLCPTSFICAEDRPNSHHRNLEPSCLQLRIFTEINTHIFLPDISSCREGSGSECIQRIPSPFQQ